MPLCLILPIRSTCSTDELNKTVKFSFGTWQLLPETAGLAASCPGSGEVITSGQELGSHMDVEDEKEAKCCPCGHAACGFPACAAFLWMQEGETKTAEKLKLLEG